MNTLTKKIKTLLLLVVLGCTLNTHAQDISERQLRRDIGFLASDVLKGRGTSSPEEKLAAEYIAGQFKRYKLSSFNNSYLKPFTYKKPKNPHDTAGGGENLTAYNVVGFLDNKAPYTIVVGAHYDHLGLGHDHNSLDANPEGKIHNGADDNASGTAGVLALARHFCSNNKTEPFNMLFLCFSGEELGLLGSKKYCDNPDLDLKTINYMINMDMIGRLNDSTRKLMVYGVGTSPTWVPLLDQYKSNFSIKKDSSGIGPSDQTSFYLKDIPVLHFFTGQHSDYHKPGDDIEKINFRGEVEVLKYIAQLMEQTFILPKLTFQKTKTSEKDKVSFKVTMGVMPDYSFEGEGMRIDGVTDGKPAAKAGIEKGDIIIGLGQYPVKSVQDYMKALSNFKKGDATIVKLKRKEILKELALTF
ncbi:MAG: M20/M25/M40 family metallo-hydrolase [Sediminibacterium sp.]|nr:M20/M25/M40 family metallo-hydrolase [Sediminibacterium sp.]